MGLCIQSQGTTRAAQDSANEKNRLNDNLIFNSSRSAKVKCPVSSIVTSCDRVKSTKYKC